MKCPFRTITTKEIKVDRVPSSVSYGGITKEVESVDFNECLGKECPYHYYGVEVNTSSGQYTSNSIPKCKRTEV